MVCLLVGVVGVCHHQSTSKSLREGFSGICVSLTFAFLFFSFLFLFFFKLKAG
jgi:uncharacterized membrane protein